MFVFGVILVRIVRHVGKFGPETLRIGKFFKKCENPGNKMVVYLYFIFV